MNLADYLELLSIAPTELIGMLWKKGDHKHTAVLPASAIPAVVDYEIPRDHDAYLAPNPTSGPARISKAGDKGSYGRGTEAQVTRIAALYADLDVKPGACPSIDAAHEVINELSSLIGERPSAIIFSGGGLQPIWTLDNCDPATGIPLLKRFGRLTKIVGQMRGMKLDSVFDAARVLRIPGTLNHKYDPPVEVTIIPDTGAPMHPQDVAERLNEVGILNEDDDHQIGKADIVTDELNWQYAVESCGYSITTIKAWMTEQVTERHPWYLKVSIRLECMRRNVCLTKKDYEAAKKTLEQRFLHLLSTQEPQRKAARLEVIDIHNEAIDRASRKNSHQLDTELGTRDGSGHVHLMSVSSPAPSPCEDPPNNNVIHIDFTPRKSLVAEDLEDGFWQARESLTTIYNAALARMCSPWAVLACCVARALATVRPNAQLPGLVGGPGSLNWFGAVTAISGGGKGSSMMVARELIDLPIYQRNLGSGEGMITAFRSRSSEDNPEGKRESVMFVADEIDNMSALSSRNGSTLMGTLRSAFMGEGLGFSYATPGKDTYLEPHTYRLTLICAIQPGRASTILNDDAGGTPQRFMWFPATDRRVTRSNAHDYQWHTFGLTLPSASEWMYPREILIPPEAREYILDVHVQNHNGDINPLDGHATFAREKLAYALAVLDGRVLMTLEDWQLSEIAAKVSNATRDWISEQMKSTQRRDAERRGEIRGYEAGAADEAKLDHAQARSDRIARWVKERLAATNGSGISNRDLRNAIAYRDRPYLDGILTHLASDGQIVASQGPQGGAVWRKPSTHSGGDEE